MVDQWTGESAKALRTALRMSSRGFAAHLGVAARTVAKWEKGGVEVRPRPKTQEILDTALSLADPDAQRRFTAAIGTCPSPTAVTATEHADTNYDDWDEDLDRVIGCVGRQDFLQAESLLTRWLLWYTPDSADGRGMFLYGRFLTLLAEMQMQQGATLGRVSAWQSYQQARRVFLDLDLPRRVAQMDLQLAVVTEMTGRLDQAAARYRRLSTDQRLGERDRLRARLWIGTALTKSGHHDLAVPYIATAIDSFDALGEEHDWAAAHQKLALAHRGAGRLDAAARAIACARENNHSNAPLNMVRLTTAQGHILASDPGNREHGTSLLDRAARLAERHRLGHQLASIRRIQTTPCTNTSTGGHRWSTPLMN